VRIRWDVDSKNVVELSREPFRSPRLSVNGQVLPTKIKLSPKRAVEFQLADGRSAALLRPQGFFTGYGVPELRVSGTLMIPTPKKPMQCPSCKAQVMPNDRFCAACGHQMPSAGRFFQTQNVKKATQAIAGLGVLYLLSGIGMFLMLKSRYAPKLAELNLRNPNEVLPRAANGATYTVAQAREQLMQEPWTELMVYGVLAFVMAGLAIWSRRAPLAAILVAAATYAVLIVLMGLNDPKTIGQGVYVKILVIALFVRGIKAALALKTADA